MEQARETERSCFIGTNSKKKGLSEIQVEQIMRGKYRISEGAGAPEAKIKNTSLVPEIARKIGGGWNRSGWIPKEGADRQGLTSQERFEIFKDGIEWALVMWGCFSAASGMFSESTYWMRRMELVERLREFSGGEESSKPFEEELKAFISEKWGAGGGFYGGVIRGGIGRLADEGEVLDRMNMMPSQKFWLLKKVVEWDIREGKYESPGFAEKEARKK